MSDTTSTLDLLAPAPRLVVSGTSGMVFVLAAPAPSQSLVIATGEMLTFALQAPLPNLVAVEDNPAIITATLFTPAPRLIAQNVAGNHATILARAAAPIMAAAGYPAYDLIFTGVAPAPRLASMLDTPVLTAYRTWVLNIRKGALTEYSNFLFNSFAVFNGQVLAAGAAGVVVLGAQELDSATAITGRWRTGQEMFGSSLMKRIPRLYMGHIAQGDLIFRVITTESGTCAYPLLWNRVTGSQQRRVPIGKGPKSGYWQFEVENVAGADFETNDLLVYPVTLRRRVQ